MNIECMLYEDSTGKGVARLCIPDQEELIAMYHRDGLALYRGVFSPADRYIVDGSAVDRPPSEAACDRLEIAANGDDVATLSGLPVPCTVTVRGPTGRHELSPPSGSLLFSASVPGDYRLLVEAFPVRDFVVTIHAV